MLPGGSQPRPARAPCGPQAPVLGQAQAGLANWCRDRDLRVESGLARPCLPFSRHQEIQPQGWAAAFCLPTRALSSPQPCPQGHHHPEALCLQLSLPLQGNRRPWRLTSTSGVQAGAPPPPCQARWQELAEGAPAVPSLPVQMSSPSSFSFSSACQVPQGPPGPRAPRAPSPHRRSC